MADCTVNDYYFMYRCWKIIKKRKRRNCWVNPLFEKRNQHGQYHHLVQELQLGDETHFFSYFRMTKFQMTQLLEFVGPLIMKEDTTFRKSITPQERLAVTLRYLATGESCASLSFGYRLGHTTVRKIISECCDAIWTGLQPIYMPDPRNVNWMEVAEEYEKRWQFPLCLGAIDGKHVAVQAPSRSGSSFYNYKHYFSVVLLACANSKCQFTSIDVGGFGRESDGGLFQRSTFNHLLENGGLHLPPNATRSDGLNNMPYVFVADEAFPLRENIMRPYPGRNLCNKARIFNYRLCRARRTVENAFGILSSRWRIYRRPMDMKLQTIDSIIKATCCLHNFVMKCEETMENKQYCPPGYADAQISEQAASNLREIQSVSTNNYSRRVRDIREKFAEFFLSPEGAVEWQNRV